MAEAARKDLIVLVADKDMQLTVQGLLSNHYKLGIRPLYYDPQEIYAHPGRDPGCFLKCESFLSGFLNSHSYALVLFDREGCGREHLTRDQIEAQIEARLTQSGWAGRAAAVVLDPELEAWVWSDSPHVDGVLGWEARQPNLRSWLNENGFLGESELKPARPKEALEAALRSAKKPRSSAIYFALTQRVSFARCQDAAFLKFKTQLRSWFPADSTA
ncbi:MAG: hypothetical protein HYR56_21970 [Acidobacteria bacterium]|nr:hypothetical protein [Acidobacteriota bacterium]MBI3428285.1 hypothetical protein [Acidobacteriota bacterium]